MTQADDTLSEALVALCGGVVLGETPAMSVLPHDLPWDQLPSLADRHGLAPAFYTVCDRLPDSSIPADLLSTWERQYLVQAMHNTWAQEQFAEIATAFASQGIEVIALKGIASLFWLYDDAACRKLSDLDLLVREESLPLIDGIMTRLGYQVPALNSEEEVLLHHQVTHIRRGHMLPYSKQDGYPVEIHSNPLASRGCPDRAVPEMWKQAVPLPASGGVKRLCAMHALLHLATHSARHLEEKGFSSLKDFVDMLLIVHHHGQKFDWREFWETAHRWDILADAATTLAALHRYWNVNIPGLPADASAVPARVLLFGLKNLPENAASVRTKRYLARLLSAGELADTASRARYLFRLLFPTPENLRFRYALPAGRNLTPYYVRYNMALAAKLLRDFTLTVCESVKGAAGKRQ